MQKPFFTSIDRAHCGKQSPFSAQYEHHRASTGGLSPTNAESPKAQNGGYQRHYLAQCTLTPPPPYSRRNVFDNDANAIGSFRASGANNTVYGSPSPDNEQRFTPTLFQARPSSATVQRRELLVDTGARPSSTIAMPAPPPSGKGGFKIEGTIVVESDPVNHTVVTQYRCGRLLGEGGFASVYEFVDESTNIVYACKMIDRSKQTSSTMKNIQMEINIHKALRHPNIIQFVKSFYDDLYVYILMERCADKNLLLISNERKTLSTPEVQHIISQLCNAVEYMHANRIVHRDIKLGNILLDYSGNVKLGDFGFANTIGKEKKTRMCGTPNYMAPEIITCNETKKGYSFEVDIWSVGVILYILTCGIPPFQAGSIDQVYEKIKTVDFTIPEGVNPSCADLIRRLLQLDPSARPTASQIRMSPFMQGYASGSVSPEHFLRGAAVPSTVAGTITNNAAGGGGGYAALALPGASPIMEPSPDALSPIQVVMKRSVSSRGSKHSPAPAPPSVFVRNLVLFSKYGYGFYLCTPTNHVYATLLNDNTKMLYCQKDALVSYYDRLCYTTMDNARRLRCFSDNMHLFRSDDPNQPLLCAEGYPPPSEQVIAGALKKFAITKFFIPVLDANSSSSSSGVDASNMTQQRSVLKPSIVSADVSTLFPDAPRYTADVDRVYVKEVIVDTYAKLCPSADFTAHIDLFAVRFSDSSFQLHIRCGADSPVSMAPETQSPLVQPRTPWSFDVLIYGNGHILFGFETEHTLLYQVVYGPHDCISVGGGKRFLACTSTSSHAQLFLPNQLLTLITEVLARVKCPSPLLDCFTT